MNDTKNGRNGLFNFCLMIRQAINIKFIFILSHFPDMCFLQFFQKNFFHNFFSIFFTSFFAIFSPSFPRIFLIFFHIFIIIFSTNFSPIRNCSQFFTIFPQFLSQFFPQFFHKFVYNFSPWSADLVTVVRASVGCCVRKMAEKSRFQTGSFKRVNYHHQL